MDFDYSHKELSLKKKLNSLDRFTLKFTDILNNADIDYVLISGYVSILFGRSRSSEDIDIFIEKLDYDRFCRL
jgi:hypothetical protein